MFRLKRSLLLTSVAMAVVCPASVSAAAIGSNYPASGAYSPVGQSTWGSASWPLGSSFTAGVGSTLEVAVYSANATNMVLEIYLADTGASATYDYTMVKGSDNIWRAAIASVPANTLYAFRAWGPNWPFSSSWTRGNSTAGFITDCDSAGNRFNPNKVLFDPYTHELSHNRDSVASIAAGEGAGLYASGGADVASTQTYKGPTTTGNVAMNCRNVDSGQWAPKSVAFVDTTSTGTKPNLNQKDAAIYETHLKGLTAHPSSVNLTTLLSPYSGFQDAVNVPNALRGTYAGAAYMAGYLKDLGINTVEFLPVHETNNAMENTTKTASPGNSNYWSYMTYGYFAPDRHYASNQALGGPTAEFKSMVAAFHAAGIEVYLDVVYNHTAEGGTWDSTGMQAELTCWRGLDNRSYYTLGSTGNTYWDSTGCGNNFNGGSTPAANLVTDSLAYWANTMGVDGFRFDECAELGRNGSGSFSSSAPLLVNIASLAAADNFKIIAEPTDMSAYEVGAFPSGWGEWNENYRDAVRRYMVGNLSGSNGVGFIDGFNGDYNDFNAVGGPEKTVNMIVCHDGFGITDQVSYGTDDNTTVTWPFGPSDGGTANEDSSAFSGNQALRRQIIRDFWAFQILSRGIPMLVWGDEMGRTVNGNNNTYDVDSVATWNNYNMLGTTSPNTVATGDLTGGTAGYANNLGTFTGTNNGNFTFLQYMLQLRAAHAAFRQSNYTSVTLSYTNADGSTGFTQSSNSSPRIYVAGSMVGDNDFVILSNLATSTVTYTIPAAPTGTHWVRLVDTNNWAENVSNCWSAATAPTVSGTYAVNNQSMVVLEAVSSTVTVAPATPTGLVATPASSSQINLTWPAVSGAASYTVYRSTVSTGPFTSLGTTVSNSYSSTGLTASTPYYYQISATNTVGTSANSATATATTPVAGLTSNFSKMYLRGTMSTTIWDTSLPMTLVANNTWQVTATLAAATAYTFKFDASGAWTTGQNWGGTGTTASGTGVVNSGSNLSDTSVAAGSYIFTFNDSTLAYTITAPAAVAPVAPVSVVASAASATQINLTWTASAGATSYTVYRAASAAGPFTTSVGTSATASFSNTGLTAATAYYYQVSASNTTGTSADSATATATTQAAPVAPVAPVSVVATAASASQINLTWTASSGATSYTIYRAASAAGPFTTVAGTSSTASYSNTGLAASTAYFYQVTASNATGTSALSATATATTPAASLTSNFAKMYLRGTMSATIWDTSLPMTLVANNTWQVTATLAAATAYTFKFDASGAWTTGQNWGGTGTTASGTGVVNSGSNLSDTSVAAGSYIFTFNDSTLAYTITAPAAVAPVAPVSVVASAASSTQINLTWTASAGATSYTIYRAATAAGPFTTSVGTSSTASYSNTGLTASTAYYYQVTASNAAGTSVDSATATATTPAAPVAPVAPVNVVASVVSASQINVTWTASAGATSYTIYRATSSAGPFTTILGTSTTASYSSTGLAAATTYYYAVTATNAAGTSPLSSTGYATTSAAAYTSNYAAMYLRGTENAWGATAMTLVGNHLWSVSVTLTPSTSYQYKLEIGGATTWSTNWGCSSSSTTSTSTGTAKAASSNNLYYTTGTATGYTFTFNDSTLVYTITAP